MSDNKTGNTESGSEIVSHDSSNTKASDTNSTYSSLDPKRPSLLRVALESLKYVGTAEKDKSVVFRHSDKISIICMFSAFVLELGSVLVCFADPTLRHVCIVFAILSDSLFGLAILWFVLLRVGAIRKMEPRMAVLVWHLMLGTGGLFAFVSLNLAFLIFVIYNLPKSAPLPL